MSDVLKDAATALWEAGVLAMSGNQAGALAEALAARGLLSAPTDVTKVRRKLDNLSGIVRSLDSAVASLHSELGLIGDAVRELGAAS